MTDHTSSFSRVIAGCMTWGSWGKDYNTSQMHELLEHCLDEGVTTFDHADIYGDYSTEEGFGKAFAASGIQRDAIQIISKCGIQMLGPARDNKVKHYNYSRDYIVKSAEQSLKKLQTEYLDLFLLHRPSPLLEPEEVAAAIDHLRQRGMVRAFGVSNFNPAQVQLIDRHVPTQGNQVEFSLTAPAVMYDGTLEDCMIHNRLVMAWSPLGTFYKEKQETKDRLNSLVTEMAGKYNATPTQVLLAWVMKHPAKIYPVVGTTRKERITEALKASEITMELEDWFLLLQASTGQEVP